jgi:hypothetical protein
MQSGTALAEDIIRLAREIPAFADERPIGVPPDDHEPLLFAFALEERTKLFVGRGNASKLLFRPVDKVTGLRSSFIKIMSHFYPLFVYQLVNGHISKMELVLEIPFSPISDSLTKSSLHFILFLLYARPSR